MSDDLQETVPLDGAPTLVRWRRSQRARRVSLRIDPRGGAVVVTLPPRATRALGLRLLTSHAGWVQNRLSALPGRIPFTHGASIPFCGTPHRIAHTPDHTGAVLCADGVLHVSGHQDFLPSRVADYLRAEAKRRLAAQAIAKSALLGRKPSRITVKDTTSRWGSCTAKGALAFSWRLILAPPFVQDYVVAHEVAHLRHMNHSQAFWSTVADLTPHTDAATTWLRTHGVELLRIG